MKIRDIVELSSLLVLKHEGRTGQLSSGDVLNGPPLDLEELTEEEQSDCVGGGVVSVVADLLFGEVREEVEVNVGEFVRTDGGLRL